MVEQQVSQPHFQKDLSAMVTSNRQCLLRADNVDENRKKVESWNLQFFTFSVGWTTFPNFLAETLLFFTEKPPNHLFTLRHQRMHWIQTCCNHFLFFRDSFQRNKKKHDALSKSRLNTWEIDGIVSSQRVSWAVLKMRKKYRVQSESTAMSMCRLIIAHIYLVSSH